jgi:large subunit ribosomal protein L6
MSRIGKHPVPVPAGVDVQVKGQDVTAKGKLGQLSLRVIDDIEVTKDGDAVVVKPRHDGRRARENWATQRTLISNLVKGVNEGYTVNLDINGVGYRAAVQGKELVMALGYSHDIRYAIPEGITIKTEKPTAVSVSGADKQKVGQVAAEIRSFRGPEPYKGKGVKYSTETIVRKEGKKK